MDTGLDARMSRLLSNDNEIEFETREDNEIDQASVRMAMAGALSTSGISVNTGPKGVRNDYKNAQRNMHSEKMRDQLRREKLIRQKAGINLTPTVQQIEQEWNQQKQQQKKLKQPENNRKSSDQSSESDDSEDEQFLLKIRAERIAAFQNSLPEFGTYERISLEQFGHLVGAVNEFVFVVCHIYRNHIEACTRLNLSFENLAKRFTHVKFVRIQCDDAMAYFKDDGLPILLVYLGGQMFASASNATQALPHEFSDLDVARLLQTKGILRIPGDDFF